MVVVGHCVILYQDIVSTSLFITMNRSKEIDWINYPHSLVGKRIKVSWKGGKRYEGRVTKYSAASAIFTVVYDDNEEKHYDLFDKTFRIEGESSDWTPAISRPLRDDKTTSATVAATPSHSQSTQNPLYSGGGGGGYGGYGGSHAPATSMYGNTGYGGGYNNYQHHTPGRYKPRERVQYISKYVNNSPP